MTEEDIKLIEQISPSIANTLRTQDKDSVAYKGALKTVESPDFQAKLSAVKQLDGKYGHTQTENGAVYKVDDMNIVDTNHALSGANIALIVGCGVGFVIIVFAVCHVIMKIIMKIAMKRKFGTVLVCTCTICSDTREELIENVTKGFMGGATKYNRTRKKVYAAGFGIGGTYYKMYQKKIYCPKCNKKTWHEIENVNDVMYDGHPELKEARDRMFEKEMNKQ